MGSSSILRASFGTGLELAMALGTDPSQGLQAFQTWSWTGMLLGMESQMTQRQDASLLSCLLVVQACYLMLPCTLTFDQLSCTHTSSLLSRAAACCVTCFLPICALCCLLLACASAFGKLPSAHLCCLLPFTAFCSCLSACCHRRLHATCCMCCLLL